MESAQASIQIPAMHVAASVIFVAQL